MNIKNLAFVGLALTLFGCPDGGTTDPTEPVDTAPPTPTGDTNVTPVPDPTFDVTLADGDGVDDPTGGNDADTLTLTITNPPAGTWYFGYAQTAIGATNGWFEESCSADADYCHPVPAAADVNGTPTSTLTLTRVFAIGDIVAGSTMLLPVDFPVSATPDVTFYIGDQTGTGNCMVFGDDVSYYSALGCTDISAEATTNQ